jgi:hypothetical protein
MPHKLLFLLSILSFSLFISCKKTSKKKCNLKIKKKQSIQKIIKVPKNFKSRSVLELQIDLIRGLKRSNFTKMNKYLLGNYFDKKCIKRLKKVDWKKCMKGVLEKTIVVIDKKVDCKKNIPAWLKNCGGNRYCNNLIIKVKDSNGMKIEFTFNDLGKIDKKWYVLGEINCKKE